jgi:PAS domain S-box-containing protein
VIAVLDRYLERLRGSSAADAAVIWSRTDRVVVCARPADLLVAGTAWAAAEPISPGVMQRDPSAVAASLPALRHGLATPPAAVLSLELTSDLVLLLVWSGAPARDELPGEFQQLFDDVSEVAGALAAAESAQALSRAGAESMLDPQVFLEAVRDADGTVTDFRYRSANPAACAYLGRTERELVGRTQLEFAPSLAGSDCHRMFLRCVEDGGSIVQGDCVFFNENLRDTRRYDIRVTRAGAGLLALTWRDITDQALAAERIADAETKYRLLAENAGDVILHARDGRIVWVSPSVEAVLGAPPEHWVGQELRVATPSEGLASLADRVKIVDDGGTVQQRIGLIGADGASHWVDVHAKPFVDAAGNQDGLIATLRPADRDVATEHAVGEARRLHDLADARFRRSMDGAAIGMCLLAPDGGVRAVNAALCELFGYDAETLKSKTWQELTAPEYLEADQRNVDDLLNGRSDSYRMLKQYIHAEGRRIWGDLSVSCVRDENGRVEDVVAQIIDVTPTIEATERYRLIAENVTDVVLRAAPDGTILWVSPSVENILGAPSEYWIGRRAREAVPPEDGPAAAARLAKALSGDVIKERLRVMSVDGTIHWAHMHGTAFYDAQGRRRRHRGASPHR